MPRKGKHKHRLHRNPFCMFQQLPPIDQQELFGRVAPLALDIGCGPGLFTADLAQRHPEWNCIGNEIRPHYIEEVEAKRHDRRLENLRGICANANLQLINMLPDDSIVFFTHNFPDPWFKKRHEKRRVLNTKFLYDLRPKLKDGCELHIMTDYQPIGEVMRKSLMATSFLKPLKGNDDFIQESTTGIFSERELVHHGKRGETIWRMAYVYDASLPVIEPPPEEKETTQSGEAAEEAAAASNDFDSSDEEEKEAANGQGTAPAKSSSATEKAVPVDGTAKRKRGDANGGEGQQPIKKQQSNPVASTSALATASASSIQELSIASPADFHVHLRQGPMSELIAPHVAQGGVSLAYVMPNLVPPITNTDMAIEYHKSLKSLAPQTDFWMTLYLSPSLTPEEVKRAKESGVVKGVKSYPRGVTTNSDGGIENYETYYPVFEAMQEHDLVLNLHGEVPSDADKNITILNAEATFLSHLHKIHKRFPKLRIVLEHATTRAAVEAVTSCGSTVACSITPHHLDLIIDDWAGKPLNFCKPVAKTPDDRRALREIIASGHERFFLGSDSAPHPLANKYPSAATHGGAEGLIGCGCAAGVYTSIILIPLCAHLLESFGALDKLEGFVSTHGRRFYKAPLIQSEGDADAKASGGGGSGQKLKLKRSNVSSSNEIEGRIPTVCVHPDFAKVADDVKEKVQVVPFWAGKTLGWTIAK